MPLLQFLKSMIDFSPRLKTHWKLAAALLVALVVGAVFAVRWWLGPQIVMETVVRREFVQSVVASGRVETAHRVDVGAQITGTVVRIPVIEGQLVKVGDVLIELDSTELNAAKRQSEMALAQAQLRFRQLREVQAPVAEQSMREAQANLGNARSVLRRNQILVQKGFISDAALEEFQRADKVADAQEKTTQKQLATTRLDGSDYALAEAGVAEAQANAEVVRARARYAVVAATVGGTLIGRNVEVGDVVQPGKVLMTLSPSGRTQLVVEIDEKNLRLLALGQQALFSPDAYPQQRLAARLVYINPGINVLTGAVQVKLDIPLPPAELRQDMTVSVDIEVARRPSTLLVPASVVRDADGSSPWVLSLVKGHAIRRPILLGLRSGGFAEVLEGLQEGDRVLPASALIVTGARVRAAPPSSPLTP